MRISNILLLTLALLVSGCMTNPIPEGYSGPRATVQDWARSETKSRASVFSLAEVDGKRIRTSVEATRASVYGKGVQIYFSPQTISREVPATSVVLKLEGRIMYSAPIQELLMAATLYQVDSLIEVTLEQGERYVVKGDLFEDKREIYLEKVSTGQRVGSAVSKK